MFETGPAVASAACRRPRSAAARSGRDTTHAIDAAVHVRAGESPGLPISQTRRSASRSRCSISPSTASETRARRSSRSTSARACALQGEGDRSDRLVVVDQGWPGMGVPVDGVHVVPGNPDAPPLTPGQVAQPGQSRTPRARPGHSGHRSPTTTSQGLRINAIGNAPFLGVQSSTAASLYLPRSHPRPGA